MKPRKNFGISQNEFNQMVADLKRGNYELFKNVFLSHFHLCIDFLQKHKQASFDDAYDATMDTLLQFRKLLVEEKLKYGNLAYLFTKMAGQIFVRNKKQCNVEEIQGLEIPEYSPPLNLTDMKLFNKSWDQLDINCQELLKLHFYGNLKLKEIAEEKKVPAATIRKQKERCLAKLKDEFAKNNLKYE